MNSKERNTLLDSLKPHIPETLQSWQAQFPDQYYDELFRLNGWEMSESSVKEHPLSVAKWTSALVYEQLPFEALQELNDHEPEEGITHHLDSQIKEVLTLFMVSDTMQDMWNQFETLKKRQGVAIAPPLPFDEQGHTKEPLYEKEELSDFNQKLVQALEYKPKGDGSI